MTDNLLARLRHWQQYGPYRPSRYKEAADRIEQLEAALLSKQVTAADKRLKQLEKGYQDLLTLDDPILMKMIAEACLAGAIDAEGKYCFVPPFSLGEKKDGNV